MHEISNASPIRLTEDALASLWVANRNAMKAKAYPVAVEIWKRVQGRTQDPTALGVVAPGVIGALSSKRIQGWATTRNADVTLRLNGRTLYRTVAVQSRKIEGAARENAFTFTLDHVWKYLGAGDYLQVTTSDGAPFLLPGGFERFTPWLRRKSRATKLFARMDQGLIFNKYGKFQKPLDADPSYTGSVIDLFNGAADHLKEAFGYKAFLFYGTLLGAIRDGEFITHDDDVDAVYISKFNTPEAVRTEFMAVCRSLRDKGYHLTVKPFGAKVRMKGARYRQSFGLHYGWIDAEGGLNIAYGHHGPIHKTTGPLAFTRAQLGPHEIDVPVDAESILEMLYTSGWKQPDPGFSHHTGTRKNDKAYHLTESEMAQLAV